MNDIKLNFVNESNDKNNSDIVIFQKNVATNFDELSIAWKVIKNSGKGDHHPFNYSSNMEVSASDSEGNFTPQFATTKGQRWEMKLASSGSVLRLSSTPATSPDEVEVANGLRYGAINASMYRSGNLLAQQTTIVPDQKVMFRFNPVIYIGAVAQVNEGEVLSSAILNQAKTEINLTDITAADIVMRGGGTGSESKPFTFSLENVVKSE
jgi:hypothetical protein